MVELRSTRKGRFKFCARACNWPYPASRAGKSLRSAAMVVAAWSFRHGLLFGEILVAGDPRVGVTIAHRATPEVSALGDEHVAASLGDTRECVGEAGFDRRATSRIRCGSQASLLVGPSINAVA